MNLGETQIRYKYSWVCDLTIFPQIIRPTPPSQHFPFPPFRIDIIDSNSQLLHSHSIKVNETLYSLKQGIASFIQTANALGICVAVSEKVSRHSKPEDFDRIIDRLYSKPQARVVVMFVDEDNIR